MFSKSEEPASSASWNQVLAKRHSHLVDSSISHDLEVLPKIHIKKKKKRRRIKQEERGKERPECLPRTIGKVFISRTLRNERLPSKCRHTSFPPVTIS